MALIWKLGEKQSPAFLYICTSLFTTSGSIVEFAKKNRTRLVKQATNRNIYQTIIKSPDISFDCFRQQLKTFLFCRYWQLWALL